MRRSPPRTWPRRPTRGWRGAPPFWFCGRPGVPSRPMWQRPCGHCARRSPKPPSPRGVRCRPHDAERTRKPPGPTRRRSTARDQRCAPRAGPPCWPAARLFGPCGARGGSPRRPSPSRCGHGHLRPLGPGPRCGTPVGRSGACATPEKAHPQCRRRPKSAHPTARGSSRNAHVAAPGSSRPAPPRIGGRHRSSGERSRSGPVRPDDAPGPSPGGHRRPAAPSR